MSKMTHKGYSARIEYDDRDGIFVGRIVGIQDIISFHADTVADLKAAFIEAVDDYLATCKALGKEPQTAASGRLMLRVSPEVHRQPQRRPGRGHQPQPMGRAGAKAGCALTAACGAPLA